MIIELKVAHTVTEHECKFSSWLRQFFMLKMTVIHVCMSFVQYLMTGQ